MIFQTLPIIKHKEKNELFHINIYLSTHNIISLFIKVYIDKNYIEIVINLNVMLLITASVIDNYKTQIDFIVN